MQKILCLLLGLCLLTGCQSRELVDETVAETKPSAEVSLPEEADGSKLPGERLAFSNPGKARVPYTGIRSYAEYVTSPDQLPQEEVFKSYDQAYFENHALVLVMETVSSGSVQLELDGLYLQEGTVTVTLKRAMPGQVGTADMATWLLWAEVEKGLDYSWTLETGNTIPRGEKY